MDWKIWGYIIVLGLTIAILLLKNYWPSYKDDNMVEEKIEDVIKDKTGIDADLTPNSPEQK